MIFEQCEFYHVYVFISGVDTLSIVAFTIVVVVEVVVVVVVVCGGGSDPS